MKVFRHASTDTWLPSAGRGSIGTTENVFSFQTSFSTAVPHPGQVYRSRNLVKSGILELLKVKGTLLKILSAIIRSS